MTARLHHAVDLASRRIDRPSAMDTLVSSSEQDTARAVELLRAGRLVAFPTETVYGLGADATNPAAVARIFAAKGRPATNPLIVHVADAASARRFTADWSRRAGLIAEAFWPGPVTLVMPRAGGIVDAVTAGLDTVGLRVPDHPVALALLRGFDGAVAAPSANRSNHISPTSAQHVKDELAGRVDLILDGGACRVGIESTVVDLSSAKAVRILRPGHITAAQLEAVLGEPVESAAPITHEHPGPASSPSGRQAARLSPGQLEVHYAPTTPAFRTTRSGIADDDFALLLSETMPGDGSADVFGPRRVTLPRDPSAYARHLYAALRHLDAAGASRIVIEMPPDTAEWQAVRDRLTRATKPL